MSSYAVIDFSWIIPTRISSRLLIYCLYQDFNLSTEISESVFKSINSILGMDKSCAYLM